MNTHTEYDQRHGGPYDRGSADAYYRRDFRPHYFAKDTYSSEEILPEQGTPEYIAYTRGYMDTVASGDFKDWG